LDPNLKAPIKKGQAVGKIVVTVNGKQKIAEIPVVAQNDVAQKGWW
jgi:D-alanyl-D-alanine carboxypeptidase (penicillin-binding protein 5/6)